MADASAIISLLAGTELSSSSRTATIHKFPSNLLRIGKEGDYIAPRTVAIGPYHHYTEELQEMEALKWHIAREHFFEGKTDRIKETYDKLQPIAHSVRNCYADSRAVEDISPDKFVSMMLIDGCFLVQFFLMIFRHDRDASLQSILHPHMNGIMRDMMLLENQIPWVVMEFLLPRKGLTKEDVVTILATKLHGTAPIGSFEVDIVKGYQPSHLVCLARFFEADSERPTRLKSTSGKEISIYTSAGDLTEIGIKMKSSPKKQFSAVSIVKGYIKTNLCLAPLNLNPTVSCWLVNMAAFEMYIEIPWVHDCAINSYLSILSLLINQAEDVRKLRAKRIIQGNSSDQATLEFFKGLGPNLSEGQSYVQLISDLEDYKHKWRFWIPIYSFFYKHYKTVAAVISIVSVLAGLFKTLFSLNQKQQ